MRKFLITLMAAGVVVGLVGGARAAKPVTVFEDAVGDAGNQDSGLPGFDQAGFDLVSGTITKAGKNLEFTATHAAMPPIGTLPEGFRLMWHFSVDGEEYRFTIKSADIGKPDVLAQSGTERVGQVYLEGVYRLEQCSEEALPAVLTLVNCNTIEYLDGSFDPAAKTATAILPMSLVKAKVGSEILGGTSGASSTSCQICWVPHIAERSLTASTVIDSAAMSVAYKVPKK